MTRRRMCSLTEVTLTVGDREYEFGIEGYTRGHPGSYWDPPEPGEIEISNIVAVDEEVITFETAALDYAIANSLTVEKAESAIYDKLLEEVEQYEAERDID